jgi:hypothetical protein
MNLKAALGRAISGAKHDMFWGATSSTTSIGAQIWPRLYRRAVMTYAFKYFEQHGLPSEGKHRVVLTVGRFGATPKADIEYSRNDIIPGSKLFEADITYPPLPPDLE